MSEDAQREAFIKELRRFNDHMDRFWEWEEEFEVGDCINEAVDHMGGLKAIFLKVSKVQGGIGVIQTLFSGLRQYAKKERV